MSRQGSRRSSVGTIPSRSTVRSSSNLALIQEQENGLVDRESVDESSKQSGKSEGDHSSEHGSCSKGSDQLREMEEGRQEGSEESEKTDKKEEKGWVQNARVVLAHVGMVLLCLLYALAGATIFYLIEQPQEHRVRSNNLRSLRNTRDTILKDLWTMTQDQSVTQAQFRDAAFEKTDKFIKLLFESLDEGGYMSPAAVRDLLYTSTILKGQQWDADGNRNADNTRKGFETLDFEDDKEVHGASVPDMWSFMGAIFFATATLTTVGYGHIAPVTKLGRLLCVGFGLLGIPLTLMTIADIGKFLGEGLKRLYRLWIRCNEATKKGVSNCLPGSGGKDVLYQLQSQEDDVQSSGAAKSEQEKNSPDKEKEGRETKSKEEPAENTRPDSEAKAAQELTPDVAGTLSVEWIFVLMVAYTFTGAGLFATIEPWSLLEAFYFCFITMTTIGYGDFVPLNHNYFGIILFYIVIGLAITTMSIDQAGIYIKKVHYFGRKIQSAKQALTNVRNMINYATWIKRRYGLTDHQLRQMACLPMFGGLQDRFGGAFTPACYKRLCWIDQRAESILEEIFTITTLESEQDYYDHETEWRAMAGNLNGHAVLLPHYKEMSKERKRCFNGAIGPSLSCISFSSSHTPVSLISQYSNYREMSQLERIAALQRYRQVDSGRVMKGMAQSFTHTSINNNCSPIIMAQSFTHTSINNNCSPKLGSDRAAINRQLTSGTLNETDGSLSLISL